VSWRLKADAPWGGRAGDEMAFDQFKLPSGQPAPPAARSSAGATLALVDGPETVTITGQAFTATFDKAAGAMTSLKYRGTELVQQPLMPDFWRAWTDNDRGARLQTRLDVWRLASSSWQVKDVRAVSDPGGPVRVEVEAAIPVISSPYKVAYTLFPTGDLYVDVSFAPGIDRLPMLPRFGMRMAMPAGFEQVHGSGPAPKKRTPIATRRAWAGTGGRWTRSGPSTRSRRRTATRWTCGGSPSPTTQASACSRSACRT
jgi:beta-galactosidase